MGTAHNRKLLQAFGHFACLSPAPRPPSWPWPWPRTTSRSRWVLRPPAARRRVAQSPVHSVPRARVVWPVSSEQALPLQAASGPRVRTALHQEFVLIRRTDANLRSAEAVRPGAACRALAYRSVRLQHVASSLGTRIRSELSISAPEQVPGETRGRRAAQRAHPRPRGGWNVGPRDGFSNRRRW